MTEELYQKLLPYKEVATMAKEHDTFVGGDLSPLFDILEKEFGQSIDRNCTGCKMGFLRFTYSILTLHENGSSKG